MKLDLSIVKRYAPLVVFILAYISILAGLITLQRNAAQRVQGIEEAHEKALARLKTLIQAQPRPSQEDAQVFASDTQVLAKAYERLIQAAAHPVIPEEPMEPVKFYQRYLDVLLGITNAAASTGVKLSPNFDMGFGYYTRAIPGANRPANDAIKLTGQLVKQLHISEELAKILITNKMEFIKNIRRVDLEGIQDPYLLSSPIRSDPDGVFWSMPFELEFSCTAPVLQNLLNHFARSSAFYIVRSLTLNTEFIDPNTGAAQGSTDLQLGPRGGRPTPAQPPRSGIIGRHGGGSPPSPEIQQLPPSIQPTTPPDPKSKEQTTNRRNRLAVRLLLDYVEFPQAIAQGNTSGAAANSPSNP